MDFYDSCHHQMYQAISKLYECFEEPLHQSTGYNLREMLLPRGEILFDVCPSILEISNIDQ